MNQLNEKGEIRNVTAHEKIDTVFLPLFRATVEEVLQVLGDNVHSIYAYGSIPEGRATAGKSDADFLIILRKAEDTASEKMEAVSEKLRKEFGELVVKVDLPTATLQEVLAPENLEGWGAYVKIFGLPVYGEDIRPRFPEFCPSLEMARQFNGDLRANIEVTLDLLQRDETEFAKQMQLRGTAGKILRSFFMLAAPETGFWSTVLRVQTEKAIEHFPEYTKEFHYLAEARKEGKDVREFVEFLREFQERVLPKFEERLRM